VEAIRQQGWDGLNAAPDFLAAYPDNATTARLEAGLPGRQREESYNDG
jgi:hypothetical protein